MRNWIDWKKERDQGSKEIVKITVRTQKWLRNCLKKLPGQLNIHVEKALIQYLDNTSTLGWLKENIPALVEKGASADSSAAIKGLKRQVNETINLVKSELGDVQMMAENRLLERERNILYLIHFDKDIPGDPLTLEVLGQMIEAGYVDRQENGELVISQRALESNT